MESNHLGQLTQVQQINLYRKLVLVREAEERIRDEYFSDAIKTPVHLGIGEEAIGVGVHHLVPPSTKFFGTYRNHVVYLAASEDTDSFFGELYGKENGCAKGKAGSMHMAVPESGLVQTSAVVATTIPVAVGAAFANAYEGKKDELVAVFFGDGAVEEGAFWESMNFACMRKLNILFVCEDNDLAIHTMKKDRRGYKSLPELVRGFDCHVEAGDGTRLESVLDHTEGLLRRMKEDPKPGFLHLDYFRFLSHVGTEPDFKAGYRSEPDRVSEMDPVKNFEKGLKENGISETQLEDIRREVRRKIDASVNKAKEAPFPKRSELFADVWANSSNKR